MSVAGNLAAPFGKAAYAEGDGVPRRRGKQHVYPRGAFGVFHARRQLYAHYSLRHTADGVLVAVGRYRDHRVPHIQYGGAAA